MTPDLRGCPTCSRSVRAELPACPHCGGPLRLEIPVETVLLEDGEEIARVSDVAVADYLIDRPPDAG